LQLNLGALGSSHQRWESCLELWHSVHDAKRLLVIGSHFCYVCVLWAESLWAVSQIMMRNRKLVSGDPTFDCCLWC